MFCVTYSFLLCSVIQCSAVQVQLLLCNRPPCIASCTEVWLSNCSRFHIFQCGNVITCWDCQVCLRPWPVQSTTSIYTTHCKVYNVSCTVYGIQYTVYSVQCTVYSEQSSLFRVQCAESQSSTVCIPIQAFYFQKKIVIFLARSPVMLQDLPCYM